MQKRFWADLTTEEFADLDGERVIAVLPTAAIEQHGPHLPVSTDTEIANGMIRETVARLPEDLAVLFLPTQAVGKSNEHQRSPGTLTLSADTTIKAWTELGESVSRAGVRKLVIVNSHGGNTDIVAIVARELRVRFSMLAVVCQWSKLATPAGVFGDVELATGIHGGDLETSMMLYFRPDLVKRDRIANFEPRSIEMMQRFAHLRATGPTAFGWIAQDLHPSGAIGDAASASLEKGRIAAECQANAFVELLRDVERFSLSRLAPPID